MVEQQIRRAGMYLRVSTRGQETDNQLLGMERFILANGWEQRRFIDHESGKTADRPQFQAMFAAASRREIDVVVFWSLDRFSREGALETLQHLNRLDSYGVAFRSLTEPFLDTCGIFKEAVISLLATLAKQERVRISERVRAGLQRARAQGAQLGRPRAPIDIGEVRRLHGEGRSLRQLARDLGVGVTTVRRACA